MKLLQKKTACSSRQQPVPLLPPQKEDLHLIIVQATPAPPEQRDVYPFHNSDMQQMFPAFAELHSF